MAKMFTFIIVLHIVMGFLSGIWQGDGGYTIHELNGDMTAVTTSVIMDTNANFHNGEVVTIGNERMHVTAIPAGGTTLTVVRGYEKTKAVVHKDGAQVYSEEAMAVQGSIQVRVAKIADASGPLAALDVTKQILGIIGYLLVSPFAMFGSDLWMISAIYTALLAGLLIVVGISMFGSRRV
jgi:hypothetical protein